MVELFIAKKHIFERKRQSLIAVLGIAIGVSVLIISISIANGLDENTIKNILSISPHIEITTNRKTIDGYAKLQSDIDSIKGVKGVIQQLKTQGILKFNKKIGSHISGVLINGIDFNSAKKIMNLQNKIIEGNMIIKKPTDFLIGKELFDKLGAEIGDEITLVSANHIKINMTIIGVFKTGFYSYDNDMIIVPLKTVKKLSRTENIRDQLNVFLNNPYDAEKISQRIQLKTSVNTRTWGDLNKNLLASLNLEKTVMILILSLIVVIAGFIVWVIINMMVKEKTRDIGILRTIGFSNKNIMNIFVIEGLLLGLFGILFGCLVSNVVFLFLKNNTLPKITNIYYLSKIPVDITYKEILIIISINIGIIFLSSLFPAYKASKLKIINALKYN